MQMQFANRTVTVIHVINETSSFNTNCIKHYTFDEYASYVDLIISNTLVSSE